MIVELHGEVDVVGEGVEVLHEQEELPDEQHRGSLGVIQCHLHLHIVVPVVSWRLCHHQFNHSWRPYPKHDANIECPSKPEYVHLWPLLGVFEFELV